MIGKVKGKLTEVEANTGLIETSGGVSYLVLLTPPILGRGIGTELDIYTHLQIRDDAHVLFGFENKQQRIVFQLLTSVSGVGPKTAFGIISSADDDEIIAAVRAQDVLFFSRVPGLGTKTAQKIILELSSKLKSDFDFKNVQLSDDDKTVVEALVSLGFKQADARKIVRDLPATLSVQDKIKEALKYSKKD